MRFSGKGKAIILVLLLVFLTFISCTVAPASNLPSDQSGENKGNIPEESEGTEEGDSNDNTPQYVKYVLRTVLQEVAYVQRSDANLWRRDPLAGDRDQIPEEPYPKSQTVLVPWDPSYSNAVEPGGTIFEEGVYEISDVEVSAAVYDFLEGWDISKRQFLILIDEEMYSYMESETYGSFFEYCNAYFPGIQCVDELEYALWEGTAEDLRKIAKDLYKDNPYYFNCLICFPEDFYNLYGMTFEQARILVRKGELNEQCLPRISTSPLYGMTPTEIAAYLADHPELLEE